MSGLVELLLFVAAAAGAAWWWRGRAWEDEGEFEDEYEDDVLTTETGSAPRTAARRYAAVDTLTLTAKKEVIRHGHTILDWLKNIQFSDKSLHEILDTGEPETVKEAREQLRGIVAQALGQFKDYMERALALDPNLAQSDRVHESFRAASILEHTIKLLAALEKPVSIAQTQQISSDVVQQPEHWGDLKDHTVDRLMDTLKGGMEEALGAMEQQAQDVERQQEEMEQVEAAHDQAHHGRKRRRRRKRQAASQATARRAMREITLDDYVLGQGAHQHRGPQTLRPPVSLTPPPGPPSPQSLAQTNAKAPINVDMDIIRQIGQTLAKSSREAAVAATKTADGGASPSKSGPSGLAMANVNADEQPRPDDVALSAQDMLKRERDQQRGPRKPGQSQPRQG